LLYRLAGKLLFEPLVRGLFRATIEGAENLPKTGAALLASNHLGMGDPIVITTMVLPRRIVYLAKAELFVGRGLGRKIVAWFLKLINTVPVDRSGGRSSREAFAPVLATLAQGNLVGIFPEGTRTPDGYLHKGKTGIARIALAADVPVIPAAMIGSETVRPFGIPWVSHPRFVIGKPLTFSQFRDRSDDHEVLRYVTDEVMNAIMALSGQEYVDVYGGSIKSGAVSEADAQLRMLPRPGGGKPPESGAGPSLPGAGR